MLDYLDTTGWALILGLWVLILSFSSDRASSRITTCYLVLTCISSAVAESLPLLSSPFGDTVTFNAITAAVCTFFAYRSGKLLLSRIFAVSATCFFAFFIMSDQGFYARGWYYVIFLTLEVLAVTVSCAGVCKNGSSRGGGFCSDLGGHIYDSRGERQ